MHYQIVLTRSGRMDEMEIHVEARPEASSADLRQSAASRLEQSIKDSIGITSRVVICNLDGIERSAGKAKRVFDLRDKAP